VAREPAELSPRRERILFDLCRDFMLRGEPVASGALQRRHELEWSTATIRAELAALERAGLLHRAHQAAGRVPTAAGLQLFIDSLELSADPSPEQKRALRLGTVGEMDPGQSLWATTRVLSELCGCVAIGFVGQSRPGVLRQIEMMPLSGRRALVVLGMDDGTSSMHTVAVDPTLAADERKLRRVHDRLQSLTIGHTLEEARLRLGEIRSEREARVDRWLAHALDLGIGLCQAATFDPLNMQVAGQPSLVRDLDEPGSNSLAHVLSLLEDWQQLAEVLCQLLPAPEDRPRAEVRLGFPQFGNKSGNRFGSTSAESCLTLVGCRLPSSTSGAGVGRKTGAVALLGPARMDYGAVVPLVEYAARVMTPRA
jgi:heat-inducible transcriptional repressor